MIKKYLHSLFFIDYATGAGIVILTLIAVAIIGLIAFGIFKAISNKRKEFVKKNSSYIHELIRINDKYKLKFGTLNECNIYHTIVLKSKRALDSHFGSEEKHAKTVVEQYDNIFPRFVFITKNLLCIGMRYVQFLKPIYLKLNLNGT